MSPNARNDDGLTPLHTAFIALNAVYWHPPSPQMAEVVEYLLARGADPNMPFRYGESSGYTLLHFAAYDGNMVLTPLLVNAGADVNARDSGGWTPLHSAAYCDFRLSCDDCSNAPGDDFQRRWKQGAKPVMRYLIEHGADVSARANDGKSVLDIFRTPCTGSRVPCDPNTRPAATPGQVDDQAWAPGGCREAYLFVRSVLERRSPDAPAPTGPASPGPTACARDADCPAGLVCFFSSAGCDAAARDGHCEAPSFSHECVVNVPVCSCDGRTLWGANCADVQRERWASLGACDCRADQDCRAGQACVFRSAGCDSAGECRPLTDLRCPASGSFCSCTGQTVTGTCAFALRQPWRAAGVCPGSGP